MTLLSIIFLIMLILSIVSVFHILFGKITNLKETTTKLGYIKEFGLLALNIGLLGQLVSLFSAFKAIEVGSVIVSNNLISEGFKVSMITTCYGLLIFALSQCIWLALNKVLNRNSTAEF